MSSLLPSRRSRPQADDVPDPARTLDTLATILISVLTILILYLAREILVPIAIAVLLSFVLSPLVRAARKVGLPKGLAVGLVVSLTFLIALGLGAILARQISDLASDAPKYQSVITKKVEGVQSFLSDNPILGKLNALVANFTQAKTEPPKAEKPKPAPAAEASKPEHKPEPPKKTEPARKGAQDVGAQDLGAQDLGARDLGAQDLGAKELGAKDLKAKTPPGPVAVEIVEPAPGVLSILQTAVGLAATPIATAAFVAIFIVFMLMQREDLRNRFIRLVGFGDLQRTTKAMDEAATRLSRYFLAQVLLNTAFGVIVAIALSIIGVPSAILWGIVAIFMRFIPYLGSVGAAIFPVAMAAVATDGWGMVIQTALLFAITEFITGQIIEPLVYGNNTGVSPIAVVLSATFWTWLWGPVGLVLSTPLTVCLVVMGRHVDRLSFLDVLLGDAPPLTPVESFYQRMLAGDPSEIADHAESYLRENSLIDYCDKVALQALLMAQEDVRRGALEDKRQEKIRDAIRDLGDDLVEQDEDLLPLKIKAANAPAALDETTTDTDPAEIDLPDVEIDPRWKRESAVLCVAGRTPLDEAAAFLLADLLNVQGIGCDVAPADSLTSDDASRLSGIDAKLIVLSFLDADLSVAQARFAVRRLRRRVPGVPIVAAFWMREEDEARITGLCSDVRCDTCAASLAQAVTICLERAAVQTRETAAPVEREMPQTEAAAS